MIINYYGLFAAKNKTKLFRKDVAFCTYFPFYHIILCMGTAHDIRTFVEGYKSGGGVQEGGNILGDEHNMGKNRWLMTRRSQTQP